MEKFRDVGLMTKLPAGLPKLKKRDVDATMKRILARVTWTRSNWRMLLVNSFTVPRLRRHILKSLPTTHSNKRGNYLLIKYKCWSGKSTARRLACWFRIHVLFNHLSNGLSSFVLLSSHPLVKMSQNGTSLSDRLSSAFWCCGALLTADKPKPRWSSYQRNKLSFLSPFKSAKQFRCLREGQPRSHWQVKFRSLSLPCVNKLICSSHPHTTNARLDVSFLSVSSCLTLPSLRCQRISSGSNPSWGAPNIAQSTKNSGNVWMPVVEWCCSQPRVCVA